MEIVSIYNLYLWPEKGHEKEKTKAASFLRKFSVPFLVAQRYDPLEAYYIFALLWSIFISSMVDCWPNYLKCASRFKQALGCIASRPEFRSTVQTQLHLLGLGLYSLKNVKGLTGGSTMYGLVAPKYQQSVCYAWREPETCKHCIGP
jgi:hypothetical protein